MKEQYYEFDMQAFHSCARQYYREKQGWKNRKLLCAFIGAIGVLILAGPQIFLPVEDLVSRALLAGLSIICSAFPFSICYVLWQRGIRKYGDPFVKMRNVFLYTNASGIQLGYHDGYDRKNPESMQVYQIAYSNIAQVKIEGKRITVCGTVELVEYENGRTGRIKNSYTSGQWGDFASFSFFDCFSPRELFLEVLKEKGIKVLS